MATVQCMLRCSNVDLNILGLYVQMEDQFCLRVTEFVLLLCSVIHW